MPCQVPVWAPERLNEKRSPKERVRVPRSLLGAVSVLHMLTVGLSSEAS
jgi:hypothetical protein